MSISLVPRREQPPDLAERMEIDKIRITITDPSSRDDVPVIFPPLWWVMVRLGAGNLCLPYYTTDSLTPPTPLEVMRDLVLVAQSVEDAESLHAWADVPMGTPIDVRTEHTYAWCTDQTEELKRLLGGKYVDYLRNTLV